MPKGREGYSLLRDRRPRKALLTCEGSPDQLKPQDNPTDITNEQTLYYALLNAKTRSQVSNVLSQLGDSEEVRPLTPLKPMGLCWFPFGGREANIATINVATHAGRSLTERITNAMDAVLEEGYDREAKPRQRHSCG